MSATLKTVFAALPQTERARAMVLNGDPKGKNFLYCNGKHVIIRDINNPSIAETYSQHSVQATVAQYSPSGYYIASGDVSGKVRVWDTVNKEHILKYEAHPFSGVIKDLCWDADSKRIAVGGQGKEVFGSVFMWDSGSSLGKIEGHSKCVNSISYKHTRPYRIVTGSEDYLMGFYEGPPFKLTKQLKDQKNFVNCVRFSPTGSHFCSVSSDKTAILFDGKTSEKIGILGTDKESHKGGIYSVSWSPDGYQLLTASADKTCKLWDVETRQAISVFNIGTNLLDQQLGCLWQDNNLLSCSLSGNINYLDKNNPDKPIRVLEGQNKNLNSICASPDGCYVFCGSNDGRISYWNTTNSDVGIIKGDGHSTQLICSLAATQDNLYSLGFDKSLRKSSNFEFTTEALSFPDKDPVFLAISPDGLRLVATINEAFLVRDGKQLDSVPITGWGMCAAFNPTRPEVAVGAKDGTVTIYSTANDSLTKLSDFKMEFGELSTIDYDPKGELLAIAGSQRTIIVYKTDTYESIATLLGHNARITALKFSADGEYIISCGLDSNVCVHDVQKKKSTTIRNAHPISLINGITWINDTTFASCGDDCCIRVWEFTR